MAAVAAGEHVWLFQLPYFLLFWKIKRDKNQLKNPLKLFELKFLWQGLILECHGVTVWIKNCHFSLEYLEHF